MNFTRAGPVNKKGLRLKMGNLLAGGLSGALQQVTYSEMCNGLIDVQTGRPELG